MRRRLGKRTHTNYSLILYTAIFSFIGLVLLYGTTDFIQNLFGKP